LGWQTASGDRRDPMATHAMTDPTAAAHHGPRAASWQSR
jgi:hypothetical protein